MMFSYSVLFVPYKGRIYQARSLLRFAIAPGQTPRIAAVPHGSSRRGGDDKTRTPVYVLIAAIVPCVGGWGKTVLSILTCDRFRQNRPEACRYVVHPHLCLNSKNRTISGLLLKIIAARHVSCLSPILRVGTRRKFHVNFLYPGEVGSGPMRTSGPPTLEVRHVFGILNYKFWSFFIHIVLYTVQLRDYHLKNGIKFVPFGVHRVDQKKDNPVLNGTYMVTLKYFMAYRSRGAIG